MSKANKRKNNSLPKLKCLLANPYTKKYPTLNENDLVELKNLLKSAIKDNECTPRAFANSKHIQIGLESSLRAIRNRRSSCVLLSFNIKPRHLITLLARNVEINDKNVPIFVQANLEDFTEDIFGVRALSLILPKPVNELGNELANWINMREKPKYNKNSKKNVKPNKKKKLTTEENNVKKSILPAKQDIIPVPAATAPTEEKKQPQATQEKKNFSCDYISFSNEATHEMDLDVEERETKDNDLIFNKLQKLSAKAQSQSNKNLKSKTPEKMEIHTSVVASNSDDDVDDFLPKYIPLTLLNVQPNPSKKKKKKCKKKKNKQK